MIGEIRQLLESSAAFDALHRVALIGPSAGPLSSELGAQLALPPETFDGVRRDLRFDLLVALEPFSDPRTLDNALHSCRAALVCAARPLCAELEARFGAPRVLGRGRAGGEPGRGSLLLLRGELDFPLIRIDDYPTGVRPIASDLEPLNDVLREFETRRVPYLLGIVPAILDERMLEFLCTLEFMQPAQHGYDHGYPRLSARLLRRGDPGNQRGTVGSINEFRFVRYATILRRLRLGKELLERRLGQRVYAYIPPCNRCDRATARALAALGIELCLSDKPVPPGHVPALASDFYGRSNEARLEPRSEVICLHATWERDLREQGQPEALPALLQQIDGLVQHKRKALARLGLCLSERAAGAP